MRRRSVIVFAIWTRLNECNMLLMNPFLKCYDVNGVLSNWQASLLACFLILFDFSVFSGVHVCLSHLSSTLCSTYTEAVPLTISPSTLNFTFVVHSHHFLYPETMILCFFHSVPLALFHSLTSCYHGDRPSAIMHSLMLSSQTCSETHTHIHNATRE